MRLNELVPELLLHIASFIPQVDLLNLSLTCKQLRNVTEPELYREYINVRAFVDWEKPERSLRAFLLHLIDRPELAKHVRRVHLRTLTHLSDVNPRRGHLDYIRLAECTPDEYARLTQAAVAAGVITDVLPYNAKNNVLWKVENIKDRIDRLNEDIVNWWENLYDDKVKTENIPYDFQFCQLLRLGVDDPFIVLLMALLPNIRELTLGKTPYQCYSLQWRVNHGFKALRRFAAWPCDGKLEWPQDLFNTVLAGGKVEFFNIAWSRCVLLQEEMIRLKPKLTSITSLRLTYCTFTKDEMSTILQACAPLRSLYYSVGVASVSPTNFTLPDLLELLQPHKISLEKLYLDLDGDWNYDPVFQTLPSIRDFTALKILDTNMHTWRNILLEPRDEDEAIQWSRNIVMEPLKDTAITLCDLLPPSLTTFIIHEMGQETMVELWDHRQILHLVAQRGSILPNFASLYFVEYFVGSATQSFAQFDALIEQVNHDDDGFSIFVSTDEDYESLNEKLFEREKESDEATHYQQWSGDRYLCEVPKRRWRDLKVY